MGAVALTAYEAAAFAADAYSKSQQKQIQAALDAEEKLLDASRKAAADRVRVHEEENRQLAQLAAQREGAFVQAFNREIAAAKTANDELVSEAKTGFSALLRAREGYIGDLQRALDKQNRVAETAQERLDENDRRRNDDRFERGLRGVSQHTEIERRTTRAETAAKEVSAIRSNPNATDADKKRADRLTQQAEGDLQKGEALLHREDRGVLADAKKAQALGDREAKAEEALAIHQRKRAVRQESRNLSAEQRRALVLLNAQKRHKLPTPDYSREAAEQINQIDDAAATSRIGRLRRRSASWRKGPSLAPRPLIPMMNCSRSAAPMSGT